MTADSPDADAPDAVDTAGATDQHAPDPDAPDRNATDRNATDRNAMGRDAMDRALAEAVAAVEHGDVPVGAVVVFDGEIVAARHNERELTGDPTAHAEVLALRDASVRVGSWRLDDCTLYVTLEPCAMCAGALVNARLGTLVYAATDPKAGAVDSHFGITRGAPLNHRVEVRSLADDDEQAIAASELLRSFFRARRGAAKLAADDA